MTGPDIEVQAPASGEPWPADAKAEPDHATSVSDRQTAVALTVEEQRICDMATD